MRYVVATEYDVLIFLRRSEIDHSGQIQPSGIEYAKKESIFIRSSQFPLKGE